MFVNIIVLWSVVWWWKEERRWNLVLAHSLLLSKITKGAARLNVPILQTNRYQQYSVPSTTVGQTAACMPVTQRARVRSPVRTSFLGEVFQGFSSPVRQMSGSFRPPMSLNIIWPSLSSSIIIHYGRQWFEMLMRPKTSNIHTYVTILKLQNWVKFNPSVLK